MGKRHDLKQMLQVGDKLFRRKSYHETGTEELLKEGNFPRSSFYHHFGNKEGFAEKALGHYSANIREVLKQSLENEEIPSALERLKLYFLGVAQFNHHTRYATACLVQKMSIELGGEDGALVEKAREEFNSWIPHVSDCIALGQRQGEIRDDLDADHLAKYLFSVVYGAYTFTRLSRDGKTFQAMVQTGFLFLQGV